ncbi:DNA-binding transcriptional regulator, CsgD family [Actinokineospora alba]|uniref:DNA-binding transcriptional regulator, CsgD family n=1 Tax=Actinokineospora alba TaxID=504798 RepID=A0A1H0LR58_9PSEU|nr:LuxR family transcriptional regulator [Actinokineospora alba]TDP67420.1 DNA-binding CsgD family transcriptional regulator [Actinokineospora alba]SDI97236.1 DNA-binding transcriptional regulator, CsgD family [Actinokineospora alba]SDO70604.1 DNA-binding transcriptional regulator, CsgD family [Actinokineospora alba]
MTDSDGPLSTDLLFSFARSASAEARRVAGAAQVLGLRGDPDAGLDLVWDFLASSADLTDDDLVAAAETTNLLLLWGGSVDRTTRVLDACLSRVRGPSGRGAVLLTWARSRPADFKEYCTEALAEFAAAGDVRGQAVTLARIATDHTMSKPAHRLRLATEAVTLAERLGDPWTVALCRGHLSIIETYQGEPGAMEHWPDTVRVVVAGADSGAAQTVAFNYTNWAFAKLGVGDHDGAGEIVAEGRSTAHGQAWAFRFAVQDAWVRVRLGDLAGAGAALPPDSTAAQSWNYRVAVRAAVAFERDRELDSGPLAAAYDRIMVWDPQVGCFAAGVLALTRHARREPNPGREAIDALRRVRAWPIRFGWEDALIALAVVDPDAAAVEAAEMVDLWPDNPRGLAARAYVEGLLAGDRDRLVEAADRFAALPEPVTAGRALHAAAVVAPKSGNDLRRAAMALLERCGADRSLAAVVRDRALARWSDHTPVPASQSRRTSAGLTAREREVALLAARGLTAAEIAETLGITLSTARNYILRVRTKFGGIPKRQLAKALGIDQA